MKNIFKVMGIAILACSMMVACGNDEENEGNNNNNGGNTEPQVEEGFVVTKDGSSWTAVEFLGRYNEAGADFDAYLTVEAYQTTAEDSPCVAGFLQATVISGATYESTGGDIINYRDVNDIYEDTEGVLGDAGGQYYNFVSDPSSFVENITAIDVNATTISGNWTENYVDIPTYIANGGTYDGAKVLSGVMTNATWTAAK